MKTRSNMPLFVVETTNIKALSNSQIDLLRCGDYLVKKTGNMQHAYKVTYKEDKHGICLTYFDAGYTETVSYDYTDGNWVYNSTDVVTTNKLEEITDADGHKRFVQGEGTLATVSGITISYNKWSLSGSHLMFVLAGKIDNTTVISNGTKLVAYDLPEWIKDKIVPVTSIYVSRNTFLDYNETGSTTQSHTAILVKTLETGEIRINSASLTATDDRYFRFEFDLLIDND